MNIVYTNTEKRTLQVFLNVALKALVMALTSQNNQAALNTVLNDYQTLIKKITPAKKEKANAVSKKQSITSKSKK